MALKGTSSVSKRQIEKDRDYVQTFFSLVGFLGETLGPRTEVVLYDTSNADNSVIAIANGEISGRHPGSPATDLMMRIMQDGASQHANYIVGYESKTATGERTLFSSTYFIRHEGRIVGMLCINTDRSPALSLQRAMEQMFEAYFPQRKDPGSESLQEENLITSVEDIPDEVIAQISGGSNIQVGRFSKQQRLDVMRELRHRGFFNFKGAIPKIAQRLSISESTAYRYLQMVSDNDN
ncbi:MAG: helix-turn-helix transcriptional regulator [Bifidobacterium sp.]|nr:helix-turn-helix transcriptional regulator [Bifidobacterium sp.]